MIIKCPECGHQVSSLAETCPNCGINIAGNIAKCPHCGGTILANQDVCPNCLQSVYRKSVRPVFDTNDDDTLPEQSADAAGTSEDGESVKTHKTLWATLAVALVIVLGVMFIGYYFYRHTQKQNERYAYDNCMLSSEPVVLQNYLDIYVSAPKNHRDSVVSRLAILKRIDSDWKNANVYCTKLAFQKYIQKHPDSGHIMEAKVKIDSLDWIAAATKNTIASYKAYMDEHADGVHYEDAKMNYNKLTDRWVTPSDERMIMQLFLDFFTSMGAGDEDGLKATLATVLNNFMQKHHASKWDVVDYMRRMHEDKNIRRINFSLNNDWKIDKIENIETGEMEFAVTFSVEQRIERTDPDEEQKVLHKVSARVSPGGKITDMNMKKVER